MTKHKLQQAGFILLFIIRTHFNSTAQEINTTGDEAVIRHLIEAANNGTYFKLTDSCIRAFPDLPYPYIGKKRTTEENKLLDYIKSNRSNEKLVRYPTRIVIAASNDLAYAYGNYTVDYDNLEKKHVHDEGSFILIFKKVNTEWLLDITYNRYNGKGIEVKN